MASCEILLQQLLLSALVLAAVAGPETNTSCNRTCGTLYIPYPFGTSEGCYLHPSFHITCNYTFNPPKPFLRPGDVEAFVLLPNGDLDGGDAEVLNISLDGKLRVSSFVARTCNDTSVYSIFSTKTFPLSYTRNKFTAIGCNNVALIQNASGSVGACAPSCDDSSSFVNGSCSGIGCCQSPIIDAKSFFLSVPNFNGPLSSAKQSVCSFCSVVEEVAYNFSTADLAHFQNRETVPLVLDWAIGEDSCSDVQKNMTSYACKAAHSECHKSNYNVGYLCTCSSGYQGNPYLLSDCRDINECEISHPCVFGGHCSNSPGSFSCSCPKGQAGDGLINGTGCHRVLWSIETKFGIGIGFLALIVGGFWIHGIGKRIELIKRKEKLFQQNGGLMLQQLMNYKQSTEPPKVFSLEEIKRATNNYDMTRIVGHGGNGTVYKGILPGNKVVAIKKSKVFDHSQIKQFINEVFLLTQINHPNVVNLLGCCLEIEVPLLVYEFITNGTLFDHIHNDNCLSFLSWEKRLKIAVEIAGALAYLHSEASMPIIHRDIKTANILLDDDFVAKVADFKASRQISLDQTQVTTLVQGTFGYLDPEYLQTGQLSKKSDVYSFGVVVAELLTSKKVGFFNRIRDDRNLAMCFVSAVEEDQLPQIFDTRIISKDNIEELKEVANLAKRCLNVRGEDRPTMKEVALVLTALIPATNDGGN